MQRSIQHQGLDFVQWPDHGLDRVSAELFESGDAFVTIDDQVAIRLIRNRDNDDRRLLSCSCQRRQQLSLPLGIPHPQVFMTAVQLVKLQLHALGSPHPDGATGRIWDCAAEGGSVSENLAESVR